jgi:hypothetical protein
MFVGNDIECFEMVSELSLKVNFKMVDRQIQKAIVFLDAREYKSIWLGNKAVYRTRMAIADGGEVIVLAPGVKEFGEDAAIDRLIRKYGYWETAATLAAVTIWIGFRNKYGTGMIGLSTCWWGMARRHLYPRLISANWEFSITFQSACQIWNRL